MEIRFRIPMAAIYCAAVIFVLSLCGVCISQKVENERLERELSDSRNEVRKLENERKQYTGHNSLQCVVQYKLSE